MKILTTPGCTHLVEPTIEEIAVHLPAHVVARIARHLDPETGHASRGEFECVGINDVVFDRFIIKVFYRTRRPDGTDGTQHMTFSYFTETMRCLPVTGDGRVVMIQEHRRQRGEWVQKLPAGGEKKGRAIDVCVSEVLDETGCHTAPETRIIEAAHRFPDDGVYAERVHYLTLDRLTAPAEHHNREEGIRGIVLVPFDEWKGCAMAGEYDDDRCEFFAARCIYDTTERRIVVRGRQCVLREPAV